MKRLLLIMCVAFALGILGSAQAQTPVEPIDLRADTMFYDFPAPDLIHIKVRFTVHSSLLAGGAYDTDLEIRLGSTPVYGTSMSVVIPVNDCGSDPDCNDPCEIEVQPGQRVWDQCSLWYTWWGGSCDPGNPRGTCDPVTVCACGAQFEAEATVDYSGETGATFEVDSIEYVNEADETNNTRTMSIATVPTVPSTWGAIKALFGV